MRRIEKRENAWYDNTTRLECADSKDQELFLPVLSHFENGNFWTDSGGRMRYRVDPVKEEDAWSALEAQVWEGPWNLGDSTVGDRPFPSD